MLLLMGGQERAVARVYAAGVIIGAVLTVVLYRWFGISSAGLAMIISEFVKGTLMRKTALERVSIDPSAIPILRAVWGLRALLAPREQGEVGAVRRMDDAPKPWPHIPRDPDDREHDRQQAAHPVFRHSLSSSAVRAPSHSWAAGAGLRPPTAVRFSSPMALRLATTAPYWPRAVGLRLGTADLSDRDA